MNDPKLSHEEVLVLLRDVGAVLQDDHFVYTSGKHGSAYVDKDTVYPLTEVTSRLCRAIAQAIAATQVIPQVVVGPEKGGIILSQWVAHHLTELTSQGVCAFYAEKEVTAIPDPAGQGRSCFAETGNFVIKRGGTKQFIPGKTVLVVEDVLNTGGSVAKVVNAVRAMDGVVTAVGAICNRGGVMPEHIGNVPLLIALMDVTLEAWEEADCPLCAQGVPINTNVGKGREFLERTHGAATGPISTM